MMWWGFPLVSARQLPCPTFKAAAISYSCFLAAASCSPSRWALRQGDAKRRVPTAQVAAGTQRIMRRVMGKALILVALACAIPTTRTTGRGGATRRARLQCRAYGMGGTRGGQRDRGACDHYRAPPAPSSRLTIRDTNVASRGY